MPAPRSPFILAGLGDRPWPSEESLRIEAGRAQVFAALVEAERARSAEIKAERDRLAAELRGRRRPWLARVSISTVKRCEDGQGVVASVGPLRDALETKGVQFLAHDGNGPGVRYQPR